MTLLSSVSSSDISTVDHLHQKHGWWTPFRRNGVRNDLCDWFASIYAAGSQWWKGWVQSYTEKMVNLTYHWLMHVIISPLNTIELCRTFRRDVATTKRQIVTLEVKNLRNNRKKINNFEFWRKLTTVMGMWLQAFILTIDLVKCERSSCVVVFGCG